MNNTYKNKSVVDTFTKNALILIILSAIAIGSLISFFSYIQFSRDSNQLEAKNLSSHKTILQREVSRVEELINFERSKLDSLIRKNIKDRVYEAHAVATALYNKYKNTKTRKEIESIIIESLRPQRFFDNRGYFYAISLDGIAKLSPSIPHIEGTNVLPFKTNKGDYYVKKLINIAKNIGEGFYDYTWIKPDEDGTFDKISFVKHFEPFDWLIGTGDYVDDVEQQIQKNILEQIGKIRFGKEGYIFVVDYDGTVKMNAGQPSIMGKNILHITDANGVAVAAEVIKLVQDPLWDGYFQYHWEKRTTLKIAPKIAYHKTVPEWRWYYGTGSYTDDRNTEITRQREKLKSRLLLHLFLIITTIAITIGILLFLSKQRGYELNNDVSRLLTFFKSLPIKSNSIDTNDLKYDEFKKLAQSANAMLDKQKNNEKQRLQYEEQILQNQKMTAINQLVGGIAHDFNNLLGVILGYGELLEMKINDDEKLKGYAHQINTAGKRGAKITTKLLSLSRSSHAEKEKCDINSLLREEEDFIKKSLTAKIALILHLKDKLWSVLIDKSDFEDVILNLCINAMHAMHEGQQDSEIIIKTDHIQINNQEEQIYNLEPGDYVCISVSDNGVGMDAETKERIFEPFYTTRETGHGLGLSQVYSFVKHSNGTILVQSTKGAGTKFEILIPRDLTPHNITTNRDSVKHLDVKGHETILVVDDESALRALTAEILSEEGYRVLQAENGIKALLILEQEKVDLVLSDIIMPIMDGNALAEKIRAIYPNIKIQLVSGYTKAEDSPEGNKTLHKNILNKPVQSDVLLRNIKLLLHNNN